MGQNSSRISKSEKKRSLKRLQETYNISQEDLNHLVGSLEQRFPEGFIDSRGIRNTVRASFFFGDDSSKKLEDSLVRMFDRDGSGCVDLLEYVETILEIQSMSHEQKIELAFHVFDTNASNSLDHEELSHIVKALIGKSVTSSKERDALVDRLWKKLDTDNDGSITVEEFSKIAELEPEIANALSGLFMSTF